MSTQQNIAKNVQNRLRVTRLTRKMESQKRKGTNCPIQNTTTLSEEGTLVWDDSKHHFSWLSVVSLVYHLRAASCLPAIFFVTQKSAASKKVVTMKVKST